MHLSHQKKKKKLNRFNFLPMFLADHIFKCFCLNYILLWIAFSERIYWWYRSEIFFRLLIWILLFCWVWNSSITIFSPSDLLNVFCFTLGIVNEMSIDKLLFFPLIYLEIFSFFPVVPVLRLLFKQQCCRITLLKWKFWPCPKQ